MRKKSIDYKQNNNIYSALMGACVCGNDLVITTDIKFTDSLILNLYDKDGAAIDSLDISNYRINSQLVSVIVLNSSRAIYGYDFLCDGKYIKDQYCKAEFVKSQWNVLNSNTISRINSGYFDWVDDSNPQYKTSEVVSYLLNVRSYTMSDTSVPKNHRGTFWGLIDKIPYLTELGINQVILMPSYDFKETITHDKSNANTGNISFSVKELPNINLWGFTDGLYYLPKGAFGVKDSVTEFKKLVKAMHEAQIEVIMQFYFPETMSRSSCVDVLEYWAFEYHLDGFYILGSNLPGDILSSDKKLSDKKLIFASYNIDKALNSNSRVNDKLAFLDDDFSITMRRFLKSDEGMLKAFLEKNRYNPSKVQNINYITTNEGFTLNDLVSYDYKHNEDNLEDNKDGTEYNYSWNCGAEGATRKKNVQALRVRQAKNILAMLILAQGTPLILAGDENLNSQVGNNNAYCQDNKVGWLDWKKSKDKQQIYEFVKSLISIRKNHPIICMDKEATLLDSLACGYPDMSYHADDAWRPRLDNHHRHVGIMLCGKYAEINGSSDDFFYMAFNMHWENHDFALPKLPKGLEWKVELFTGEDSEKDIIDINIDKCADSVNIPYRSVAILKSHKRDNNGGLDK